MNALLAMKERIETLPAAERNAAERQILADLSRTSAYQNPLGSEGEVSCFALRNGFDVEFLQHDVDIAVIHTQAEWKAFISAKSPSMALITKASGITAETALATHTAFTRRVNLFCE